MKSILKSIAVLMIIGGFAILYFGLKAIKVNAIKSDLAVFPCGCDLLNVLTKGYG